MRMFLLLIVGFLSSHVMADQSQQSPIERLIPGAKIESTSATPLPGIVAYTLSNGQVIYGTEDGSYVLGGPMVQVESGTNLTLALQAQFRSSKLENMPGQLFKFPAQQEKYQVTVVTDIDCPYCRRLHQLIPEYNAQGISLTYVMLPRSGPQGPAFAKAVNAACAIAPESALTRAMNGESITASECENTIAEQLQFARSIGANKTPSIVFPDGHMIEGMLTPEQLLEALAQR